MKLREYQERAISAIDEQLAQHQSTLLEMATGCGKTVIFAAIVDRWPGNVLVIAHRDELIRQAADKVQAFGIVPGIEVGGEYALHKTKCVIATVQTMYRERRRERFGPEHFSLIIIDEGHHAPARTYRELLNYFGNAKHLLVTATAKRTDEIGMNNVCKSVAFRYGIEQAIDDGWLVPIQQKVIKVDGLDFSAARTVAEDFNQADLERILTEEEPLHRMCASAHEVIAGRQSLWFCVSVAHARACAAVLSRYVGAGEVAFASGETPMDDRRRIVADYKAGRIKHLLNCALWLEGFDAPNTQVVVMGRPTKSLLLYMQVIGRGTRALPGLLEDLATAEDRKATIAASLKPNMLVIDFAGNAGKHKIIQATDVLSGKYSEGIRNYAKKTMEKEGEVANIAEALDRADAETELLNQEMERRKEIRGKASYRTYDVDPFSKQYQPKPVSDAGMQKAWERIVAKAIRLGRKAGWCIHAFKSRFGVMPWEANVSPLANGRAGEWKMPAEEVLNVHN